jgi:hypothetical protein
MWVAAVKCRVVTLHNNKKILFGNFYSPPYADSVDNSFIDDSSDIFVTGDFNYNTQNRNASLNIASLCQENDLVLKMYCFLASVTIFLTKLFGFAVQSLIY